MRKRLVSPNTAVRVAVLNGTFAKSEGAVTPDRLVDLSVVGPAVHQLVIAGGDSVNYESKWATLTFQVR